MFGYPTTLIRVFSDAVLFLRSDVTGIKFYEERIHLQSLTSENSATRTTIRLFW